MFSFLILTGSMSATQKAERTIMSVPIDVSSNELVHFTQMWMRRAFAIDRYTLLRN